MRHTFSTALTASTSLSEGNSLFGPAWSKQTKAVVKGKAVVNLKKKKIPPAR